MVDAAYEDLYGFLRPGVRENECVGLVAKTLYDLGSEYVEGVNAISGERCAPHPHVYSDRILRPGDPAFFDILHSHLGYRTCYYRCFAVGSASPAMRDAYVRCREYMDQAIALVRPGATTADIVSVWPRARGVRLPQRGGRVRPAVRPRGRACRSGRSRSSPGSSRSTIPRRSRRAWSSPSRRTGRRSDGWSAARIEEELVVTADGCEVITKFPAEELLVAGKRYWTAAVTAATDPRVPVAPEHPTWRPAADAQRWTAPWLPPTAGRATLLELYEQMVLIRRTEQAAYDLFMAGLVKGTTHLAAGHEAVAVGAARRCDPTTTCSPPTAATTTRSPAAPHPRSASPS